MHSRGLGGCDTQCRSIYRIRKGEKIVPGFGDGDEREEGRGLGGFGGPKRRKPNPAASKDQIQVSVNLNAIFTSWMGFREFGWVGLDKDLYVHFSQAVAATGPQLYDHLQ